MTKIVLIDKDDKVLGLKEKFDAHKIPVSLHRAISIVIFNKDKSQMLITKRSAKKPTWPYFWTNSVCSHPYPEETYQKAAERRLYEELGFKTPLKEIFAVTYKAEMDNKIWGEHELDHVFVGKYDGEIRPDPNEVSGFEWIKISDLEKDIKSNPEKYSPWSKMILEKLKV
jgi:isopentenyl-diphosphate delta-isomerase